ncbi:hypothetical protein [Methanogenium cariaci]|nr:hypothetical protein [Methanogenium cariaci]
MQDARLRIGATLLLSCAAFSSVLGAALAALWWGGSWHAMNATFPGE